jgi:hypothetical protein
MPDENVDQDQTEVIEAQIFIGSPPPSIRPLRPSETPAQLAAELGLARCPDCHEFKGTIIRDGAEVKLLCVCDGIPCRRCKTNRIRRPISDHFNEFDGRIWHSPYFAGLLPCTSCREKSDR